MPLASARDDRLEPAVALEPLDRLGEVHLDAVVAVQPLDRLAEVVAEDALERRAAALDDGDVDAAVSK
jgi:hypothetical protein